MHNHKFMKYIVLEANPIMGKSENQRGIFEYSVTNWYVKYKEWDGMCMCTMVTKEANLNIHELSYSRGDLINEIRSAVKNGTILIL